MINSTDDTDNSGNSTTNSASSTTSTSNPTTSLEEYNAPYRSVQLRKRDAPFTLMITAAVATPIAAAAEILVSGGTVIATPQSNALYQLTGEPNLDTVVTYITTTKDGLLFENRE